jgi:hypothetical protein
MSGNMSEEIIRFITERWIELAMLIVGILTLIYLVWWNVKEKKLKIADKKILKKEKKVKSQKQISAKNIGETYQAIDSKLTIDKSKHFHIMPSSEKKGPNKFDNDNKPVIQVRQKQSESYKNNRINHSHSKSRNHKLFSEKNDVKPLTLKEGDFNLQPNNLNGTYYDDLHGVSGKTFAISLGELNIGDSGEINCQEVLNQKFSCFVVDETNFNHFGIFGDVKKSLNRRRNVSHCTIKFKIKFKGKYYIIFKHRGQVKGRRIKYRLEINKIS